MVSEKKESLEKDQEKIELKVTSGENKETLSDFLTCADSSLEVSQKENFSENKSLQNISLNGEKTFLKFEEQCKKAKQKNYFSNTVQILIIVSLLAVFIFQSITHQFWNLNSIGVFGVVLFLFYVCIFTGFTLQACKFFRLNLIYDFLVIFSYPAFAFWISSTARKNLARVFLRWKENDQAFECYRKTLSSGGEYSGFADAEVLIEMASIDFLRGRVNSAVELARRSCDRAYHMADSTGYGMGDMKKYGDFKKSKSKYLLGFLYYELKKYDLASDLIGEAIDLSEGAAIRNRNNSSVDYGAIDHRLNCIALMISIKLNQGDLKQASDYITLADELMQKEDFQSTVEMKVNLLLAKGKMDYLIGDFEAAEEKLFKACCLATDYDLSFLKSVSCFELGTLYKQVGDRETAEKFYRFIVEDSKFVNVFPYSPYMKSLKELLDILKEKKSNDQDEIQKLENEIGNSRILFKRLNS